MAADVNSLLLGLLLQGTGNNDNTWGENLNNFVFGYLEQAVAGYEEISVNGGSDQLTADQIRVAILEFTGTLLADQTIEVDNVSHHWIVRNSTTGSFALKFKTASGTEKTVRQGGWSLVWCDGADNIYVGVSSAEFETQLQGPNGAVGAPAYSFASDPDSGMRRKGANNIALGVGGADVIDITTAGANVTGLLTVNGESPVPIGGGLDYDGILEPTGWKWRNGQALSRTTHALLFEKLTITATATRNGTTTLSSVSVDLRDLGLEGAVIEGNGITTGTTVSAVTANTITLSQAASGSGSMTIRILPHGAGDNSTTFNVPDDRDTFTVGRHNMGGTDANRISATYFGATKRLGGRGGSDSTSLSTTHMASYTPAGSVSTSTSISPESGGTVLRQAGSQNVQIPGALSVRYADATTVGITASSSSSFSGTSNGGASTAFSRIPPSRYCNKIIFTGVFS